MVDWNEREQPVSVIHKVFSPNCPLLSDEKDLTKLKRKSANDLPLSPPPLRENLFRRNSDNVSNTFPPDSKDPKN